MTRDVLGIGLAGKQLSALEKRILSESSPYAVVLFGRNIDSPQHLRELVEEVKSVAERPPLFMIDEEGGRVDRLRHIVPGLPSAEGFGEGERPAELSEWFGRVIGVALRYFDIEIDLAPVVDISGEVAPKGLERRVFGHDPETVIDLAGAFMRGLHGAGVASCLKHWPGIGVGSADPHYGATVIDIPVEQLIERDLVPYQRLANQAGAVMIGHGTYPQIDEPDLPATLSWRMTTDLLRNFTGFKGVAISDDMEMHAVSDLGSYEEISEQALMAGNDVILYCSHIERIPDLQRHILRRVDEDERVRARFDEAVLRCEAYRAHCERLRAAAPAVKSFDDVIDEAARFVDEYERTRPHREVVVPDVDRRKNSRNPRTGREEWT
ncbi:MAG TPA: beta-N-acetylhexosaminidase [Thermoanaerobaculia bacterium]|jgi:beta-N-acetylhexosaminidase